MIYSYWRQLFRYASNILWIGGNSRDVPPIFYRLVATLVMWLQYFTDWWQLLRCPSNTLRIGGNSCDVPPILLRFTNHSASFSFLLTFQVDLTHF